MFFCCVADESEQQDLIVTCPELPSVDEKGDALVPAPKTSNPSRSVVKLPGGVGEAVLEPDAGLNLRLVRSSSAGVALGLQVDVSDGKYLYVYALNSPSLIADYNETVPLAMQIMPGDYITSVNGRCGDANELEVLLTHEENLELAFVRPTIVTTNVEKKNMSLGLRLKYSDLPGRKTLTIIGIGEGAVQAFECPLRVGDRILEVNGVSGEAATLLAALSGAEMVHLRITRPAA
eukprot:TRINITY_DN11367_c0_g5_i1.p1 TRINITY_DN11367_c0_g5~~TRINITY_DN11367_c0_g5_i1.p1  ORF type:complete len:234 (+),score=45.88 TRINITY_DN11367_c0_g5_i1:103-804(+)